MDPAHVDVVGRIDDVPTPVGFVITPIVGLLEDPPPFEAQVREVERYFEVGVKDLVDPVNFRDRGVREIAGIPYPVPEYRVAGQLIWGATARITQRFLEVALGDQSGRS